MNQYVNRIMGKWAKAMLTGDGVCIQNDPEEMNWRIFFAHSQDMGGFRADIFTGGINEDNNPCEPGYKGLRDRWDDSKSMMQGLASLWQLNEGEKHLRYYSNPMKPRADAQMGIAPLMELLRGPLGNEATRVFADTLEDLTGYKIARKTCGMIRAYCQNSALLSANNYSFQDYIYSKARLPAKGGDMAVAEAAWVRAIERDFYNVGPALSNYMVCDWLLALWREQKIDWFQSYKPDSVHLGVVAKGLLPVEARDFAPYCRSLNMLSEWTPDSHPNLVNAPVPPRLLNEAIWLEENQSNKS